ncbi:glycosyltransferase family 4 protein [Cellulomonas sp. H30R-01]|uniref:D-inositol 3-phosphate glycosyltransferase n=1 Tax=Cellulomonas algicola TaxID=2071633 RepID=A0A401UV66_9CELL|nr:MULTISPECIES: glycosyltransferase [Cellulomonas]QHT56885.1 glycosyltransferase family 4 protein [Cellulomonas sp. H30R-01]GCD18575.1 glycosyl transferase [Cellulomonas algicola]
MGGVLVHEWLARTGGSENVFDALVEAFPAADLLCLWNDVPGRYPGRQLDETWLARTPLRRRKALALAAMPAAWRGRRGEYDWALVSSHAFAHHVSFRGQPQDFAKLVYVHSPARYLWEPDLDARGAGAAARVAGTPLRALDRARAREITAVAANSRFVAERVRRAWETDATVVHPPVDVARIRSVPVWADRVTGAERQVLDGLPDGFVLGASRLVPYKRLDLVVRAGEASGRPVVIAGSGPERARLGALAATARVPVTFVDAPSDELLFALYQACAVYVFPAVEDFGIMPVEAMAAGAAVVGGHVGGVTETVVDGVTGRTVDLDDAVALAQAVEQATTMRGDAPAARAEAFDRARFLDAVRAFASTAGAVA